MKFFFIPAFIFTFHFQAIANKNFYEISSFEIKRGKTKRSSETCYIPTLSDQQSYIIDEIRRIHLLEAAHTLLKIAKNKEAYSKILTNKKIPTAWLADEAAEKLYSSRRSLLKQQTIYFHAVYYQVLLADQRSYLISCL